MTDVVLSEVNRILASAISHESGAEEVERAFTFLQAARGDATCTRMPLQGVGGVAALVACCETAVWLHQWETAERCVQRMYYCVYPSQELRIRALFCDAAVSVHSYSVGNNGDQLRFVVSSAIKKVVFAVQLTLALEPHQQPRLIEACMQSIWNATHVLYKLGSYAEIVDVVGFAVVALNQLQAAVSAQTRITWLLRYATCLAGMNRQTEALTFLSTAADLASQTEQPTLVHQINRMQAVLLRPSTSPHGTGASGAVGTSASSSSGGASRQDGRRSVAQTPAVAGLVSISQLTLAAIHTIQGFFQGVIDNETAKSELRTVTEDLLAARASQQGMGASTAASGGPTASSTSQSAKRGTQGASGTTAAAGTANSGGGTGRNRAGGSNTKRSTGGSSVDPKGAHPGVGAATSTSAAMQVQQREHEDETLAQLAMVLAVLGDLRYSALALKALGSIKSQTVRVLSEFTKAILKVQRSCTLLEMMTTTDSAVLTLSNTNALKHAIQTVDHTIKIAGNIKDVRDSYYITQMGCVLLWNLSLPLLQHGFHEFIYPIFSRACVKLSSMNSNLNRLYFVMELECSRMDADSGRLETALERLHRIASIDYSGYPADPQQSASATSVHMQVQWLLKRMNARRTGASRPAASLPADLALNIIEQTSLSASASRKLLLAKALDLLKDATAIVAQPAATSADSKSPMTFSAHGRGAGAKAIAMAPAPPEGDAGDTSRRPRSFRPNEHNVNQSRQPQALNSFGSRGGGAAGVGNAMAFRRGQRGEPMPTPSNPASGESAYQGAEALSACGEQQWPLTPVRFVALLLDHLVAAAWRSRHTDLMPIVRSAAELFVNEFTFKEMEDRFLIHKQVKAYFVLADTYVYEMGLRGLRIGMPLQSLGGGVQHRRAKPRAGKAAPVLEGGTGGIADTMKAIPSDASSLPDDDLAAVLVDYEEKVSAFLVLAAQNSVTLLQMGVDDRWSAMNAGTALCNLYDVAFTVHGNYLRAIKPLGEIFTILKRVTPSLASQHDEQVMRDVAYAYVMALLQSYIVQCQRLASGGGLSAAKSEQYLAVANVFTFTPSPGSEPTPSRGATLGSAAQPARNRNVTAAQMPPGTPGSVTAAQYAQLGRAAEVCQSMLALLPNAMSAKDFCLLSACVARLLEGAQERSASSIANGILGACDSRVDSSQYRLLQNIGQLEYLTHDGNTNGAKCASVAEQAFAYLVRDPNMELCSRLALILCRVPSLQHLVLQVCNVGDEMYAEGQLGWKRKPERSTEEPRKNGKGVQQNVYEITARPHSHQTKRGGNTQHNEQEKVSASPAGKAHPRAAAEDNASATPVTPHDLATKVQQGHRRGSEGSSVDSNNSDDSSSGSDRSDDDEHGTAAKGEARRQRARRAQPNEQRQESPSSEDWFWYAKLLQCKATATVQRSEGALSGTLSHREVILSALVTLVNSALAATRAPATHRLAVVIDAYDAYRSLTTSFGGDATNRRQLLPSLRLMLSPFVYSVIQRHIDSSSNRMSNKTLGKGETAHVIDLHYAITVTLDLWHLLITCLMDAGAFSEALKVVSQLLTQLPNKYHRSLLTVDVQCRCQLKEPLARALTRLREYDKLTQSAIWMKVAVYSTAPAEQRDAFVTAIGLLNPSYPTEYATALFLYALWMLRHSGTYPGIALLDITQALNSAVAAADISRLLELQTTKLSAARPLLVINIAIRSLLTLYRVSSTIPHSSPPAKPSQKVDAGEGGRGGMSPLSADVDETTLGGFSIDAHLASIVKYVENFWLMFAKKYQSFATTEEKHDPAEGKSIPVDPAPEHVGDAKPNPTDKNAATGGVQAVRDALNTDSSIPSLLIPLPSGEWMHFLFTQDFNKFHTPHRAGVSAFFESSTSACDARELIDSLLDASYTIVHHSRAEHLAAPLLALAKMLLASPAMSADPLFQCNSTLRCSALISEAALRCGLDSRARNAIGSVVSSYLNQVAAMKPTENGKNELIERVHMYADSAESSHRKRAHLPHSNVVADPVNGSDWLIYPYWIECANTLLLSGQLSDAGYFTQAAQSLASMHGDMASVLQCGCLSASILLRVGQTAAARSSLELTLGHDQVRNAQDGGSLATSAGIAHVPVDADDIVRIYYLQLESLLEEDRELEALEFMESLEQEFDAGERHDAAESGPSTLETTWSDGVACAPHAYETVIVKLACRFASAVAFHRKGRSSAAATGSSVPSFSGLATETYASCNTREQPKSAMNATGTETDTRLKPSLDDNERRLLALLHRASQRCIRNKNFLVEGHDELTHLHARLVCDSRLQEWAEQWSSAALAPMNDSSDGTLSDRLTRLTAEAGALRMRIAQLSHHIQELFETSTGDLKMGLCRPSICRQLGIALLLLGRNTRQRLSIREEILRVYHEHPADLMRIPEGNREDLQHHVVAFMRAARRQQDAEAFHDAEADKRTTLPQTAVRLLQSRLHETTPRESGTVQSVPNATTVSDERSIEPDEVAERLLANEPSREKSLRGLEEGSTTGRPTSTAPAPQRSKMSASASLRSTSGMRGRVPSAASRSKKRDQRTHASTTRPDRHGDGKTQEHGSENATQEERAGGLQVPDISTSHTGGAAVWSGFSLCARLDGDGAVNGLHSSDEVRDAMDVFHVPRDVAVETTTLDMADVMEVFFAADDMVEGNAELCNMLYLEHASAALQKAIEHVTTWEQQRAAEEKKSLSSCQQSLILQKKWTVSIRLPERKVEARQRSARARGDASHERERKPVTAAGGTDASSHDRPKRRNLAVPSAEEVERDGVFTSQLKTVSTSALSSVVKLFDKAIDAAARCVDYEGLSNALTGYATCCALVDGDEISCRAIEQAVAARTCGQILQLWRNFAPRRSHERILYASVEHIQRHTPHLIDSPYFADLIARLLQSSPVFQTILPTEWMDRKRGSGSIYESIDGHRTGCFLGLDICAASVSISAEGDFAYVVVRRPDGVAHTRRVRFARGLLNVCAARWQRFCDMRATQLSESNDNARSTAAAASVAAAGIDSVSQLKSAPVLRDDVADQYHTTLQFIEDAVGCFWEDFLPLLSLLSGEQNGRSCRLVLCLDPLLQPLPLERLHVFSRFRSIHREVSVPHLLKKLRHLNGEKLNVTSRVATFVDVYHESPDSAQCVRTAAERIKSVTPQLVCPVMDGNDMVRLPDVQSALRKIGCAPSQDSSGFNVPSATSAPYELASTMTSGLTPAATNFASAVQVKSSGGGAAVSAPTPLPDVLLTNLCGALPNSLSLATVSGLNLSRVRCAAIFDHGMNAAASRRENKQDIRKNIFFLVDAETPPGGAPPSRAWREYGDDKLIRSRPPTQR